MIKFIRFLVSATFLLLPQTILAGDAPHLYGCYFSQAREPGQWVTSTAALFIEKAPDGILLHGSLSSGHNSWISTPDDKSPVLLTKIANKFVYQGEVNPENPQARCELILHYDQRSIYVKKYDQGCRDAWYTGDGIGPNEMSFADKQPNADVCLAYLGIIEEEDENENTGEIKDKQ